MLPEGFMVRLRAHPWPAVLSLPVMIVLPIPAPIREIDLFVILTRVDHVQLPGGTITVSPSPAELTAVWTSAAEQLAAVMVAAETVVGSDKLPKIAKLSKLSAMP